MNDNNRSNLQDIIRGLDSKTIVLPDFQREFVWRDEEMQKKLVASVLARMPIGSILLLKSSADEYETKTVGCKSTLDLSEFDGKEVSFVLDGQQRITVLANVFSNIIHDHCKNVSDLSSPALKRRFFLKIPKWSVVRSMNDIFGVHDLVFKYTDLSKDPEFLSGDMLPYIEAFPFLADDQKPYNPKTRLSVDLDTFCISQENCYLLPLYLLVSYDEKNKQIPLRYKNIVESIPKCIKDEITNHYAALASDEEKKQFIDEMVLEEDERSELKADLDSFYDFIEQRQQLWEDSFKKYLQKCYEDLALNEIVVNSDQRARAIDIYENLNLGGVSLSTFDLIMARVAKVSKENFYNRMVKSFKEPKTYPEGVVPAEIKSAFKAKKNYNATMNTGCYSVEKNETSSQYVKAFLNVLSLYINNPEYKVDDYKVDYMKRDQILKLTPTSINDSCDLVWKAMDRALFFFQTRCGIRYISEINYDLMITLVALIFIKDEYFNDNKVHQLLEAWYWTSIFSGEYDKDQNVKMISHLQLLIKTITKRQDTNWLRNNIDLIFNLTNFSDKALLLMEKTSDERYPKAVLRNFVCQYFLSKVYTSMFDAETKISVFCDDYAKLEAHHIIPLGSVTTIGESTSELRNNREHICNSPLNFVLITKSDNDDISDDPLDVYAKKLCSEAKSDLMISEYDEHICTDDQIKSILNSRFTFLQGSVKKDVRALLDDFDSN